MSDSSNLVQRRLVRDMPDRSRIVARLEVRLYARGLSPAFSLTGEIFQPHGNLSGATRAKRYARLLANGSNIGPASEPDSCGMVHDEILRAFPKLEQFARMHLADPISGAPMHALANGWYFYAPSQGNMEDQYNALTGTVYAHQLEREGLPDTEEGRRQWSYRMACKILRVDEIPPNLSAEQFSAFVDDQRERWQSEAAEARAFVESLPEDGAL